MQPETIIKRQIREAISKAVFATGFFKDVLTGNPSPQMIGDPVNLPIAAVIFGDDALRGEQITGETPGTFIAEHRAHVAVLAIVQKPDYATDAVSLKALDDQLFAAEAVIKQALNEQQPGGAQLMRWYSTKTAVEWASIARGSIMPVFYVDWQESVTDPTAMYT